MRTALDALSRVGTITPEIEAALRTIRARDRRLSPPYGDYRAVPDDEALRGVIGELLTGSVLRGRGVAGAGVRAEDGKQASSTP